MNINDCGKSLLNYFTLEERSIPDSVTYPGRNAEVIRALNAAGQDLYGKGKPWCRKQPRGAMVNAPVTIELTVTEGSSVATIPAASFQSWFTGCAIRTGGECLNRIKASSITPPRDFPLRLHVRINDAAEFGTIETDVDRTGTDDGAYYVGTDSTGDLQFVIGLTEDEGYDGKFRISFEFVSSPILGRFLYSPEAGALPLGIVEWEAVGWTPDTNSFVTLADLDPELASITLQNPYIGESGTIQATIYHDTVALSDDVLEVHEPVELNCRELRPHNTAKASRPARGRDYGFIPTFGLLGGPRRDSIGTPEFFHVENVVVTTTEAPKKRLRLIPAPTAKGVVEYEAMLVPPRVTSLSSADDLPVPFEFVESIFLPIAVKKLRGCPFWAGIIGDSQVDSDYRAALELLAESEPQRRSGIRFVPRL